MKSRSCACVGCAYMTLTRCVCVWCVWCWYRFVVSGTRTRETKPRTLWLIPECSPLITSRTLRCDPKNCTRRWCWISSQETKRTSALSSKRGNGSRHSSSRFSTWGTAATKHHCPLQTRWRPIALPHNSSPSSTLWSTRLSSCLEYPLNSSSALGARWKQSAPTWTRFVV